MEFFSIFRKNGKLCMATEKKSLQKKVIFLQNYYTYLITLLATLIDEIII